MKWQTYELYLRNLMAQQLEIPILGELHFAVPNGSGTSRFEEYARTELDIPAELLSVGPLAPAQAFGDCSAARNDCVLVFPGAYDIDTELAWNKDWVHLLGMGGPNVEGDYTLPGVTIYSDNVATEDVIDVTGDRCQFRNFEVSNAGNNAACLAALNLDGWGARFKNVSFQGVMTAGNDGVAAAASLYIDKLGHFPLFENCVIGQHQWDIRTAANSGMLRFVGTSVPSPTNGIFRDCIFRSRSETATVAMVVFPHVACIDGPWLFERVHFYNKSVNWTNDLNGVFYNVATPQTTSIILKDCSQVGFTEWQTQDAGELIMNATPLCHKSGGTALEAVS